VNGGLCDLTAPGCPCRQEEPSHLVDLSVPPWFSVVTGFVLEEVQPFPCVQWKPKPKRLLPAQLFPPFSVKSNFLNHSLRFGNVLKGIHDIPAKQKKRALTFMYYS
jgi:hypothetical protein